MQTRYQSLIESIANVLIGYLVALGAQDMLGALLARSARKRRHAKGGSVSDCRAMQRGVGLRLIGRDTG